MVPVSMTLSYLLPRFQGHDIIQRQITRKWYNIKLYLQWPTSNGAVFNDIERPQTQISRSDHSLPLNIPEMAKSD